MDDQTQESNQYEIADSTPSTIYHYCSLDTFSKIISSSTIRLYDVCRSNDSMEAKWTTRAFCSYMRKYIQQIKDIPPQMYKKCAFLVDETKDAFIQLSQQEKDKLRQISKEIQTNKAIIEDSYTKQAEIIKTLVDLYYLLGEFLAQGAYLYVWVFCLSIYGDSLGQWRGYGDDGHGISIGFKESYLSQLNNTKYNDEWPFLLGLSKAEYSSSIEECKDILGLQKLEDSVNSGNLNDILSTVESGIKKAYELLPVFKHPSFAEEAEWRLFLLPAYISRTAKKASDIANKIETTNTNLPDNVASFSELSFDVRNRKLISYVPMRIHNLGAALNEIIIGPKSTVQPIDIFRLLVQYGVVDNMTSDSIIIRKSDSTYN